MTLTAEEMELGWVEFVCEKHGFLVAMTPRAVVWCKCGKQATRLRGGRVVDRDLKLTEAKARASNGSGKPSLHLCPDCQQDFGGGFIHKRHRVGTRGKSKRCLTSAEMRAKGWRLTKRGRWSLPRPNPSQEKGPQEA